MVVVMGIMLAIAMPLFLNAMNDAKKTQCRSNLQSIANTNEQHKLRSSTRTFSTNLNDLGAIQPIPLCPEGGTYTITLSNGTNTANNGKAVPSGVPIIQCSISNHGKFAGSVDTY